MQKGMEKALKDLKVEYDVWFYQLKDWERDDAFVEKFRQVLNRENYDIVLSVNYCPLISDICQSVNIKYVSWVYDAPIHIRDTRSFHNSCNRVYFFDGGQVKQYQKKGYSNIFHLPLAAEDSMWQFSNQEKYACDVAFVGRLYQSDYEYLMGALPQYYRGITEGFISAQGLVYGAYFLDELITDSFMDQINEFYLKKSNGQKRVERAEMEFACACEVTGRERFMALSLLSKRYHVHVYSGDDVRRIEGAEACGPVEYYTEMPSAFRGAKVNLNISLKAIRTGIPLRVLDVLSCGGFLITNFQEELLEYFEPDVDLVIYQDMKDMIFKVDYYLKHEEERERIAKNGYRKIKKYFSFGERMGYLLL